MENAPKYLTPQDWISAGVSALGTDGAQALTVEGLARGLGVSKGSFYWHFRRVGDLRAAVLARWGQGALGADASTLPPADALHAFVAGLDSAQDAAVRHWARYDKAAAKALRAVDLRRLQHLEGLFRAHGTPAPLCRQYANVLYGGIIGAEVLSLHWFVEPEQDVAALLDLLLAGWTAEDLDSAPALQQGDPQPAAIQREHAAAIEIEAAAGADIPTGNIQRGDVDPDVGVVVFHHD